jgi:hypothetical protein
MHDCSIKLPCRRIVGNNDFDVFSITNTGTMEAGYFRIDNTANKYSALIAGTNGAADGMAIFGYNDGMGKTAHFMIRNRDNKSNTLEVDTNGRGNAIFAKTNGAGNAGDFRIENSTNNANALRAETDGGGNAIFAKTTGDGNVGDFRIENSNSNRVAVYVETNGKDAAVRAKHTGSSGGGGDFVIDNTSNDGNAVRGHTKGTGNAGEFVLDNSGSKSVAVYIKTNGLDAALRAVHTGSGGYAADFDGTVKTKVLEITGGSDLAEPFLMSNSETIPKGSVVVIDDENPGMLKLSDRPYDKHVAGVVSGAGGIKSGLILSQEGIIEGGQNVAISGRVYALTDASNGPIKPGDLLTTSNNPGYVMKAIDKDLAYGAVIGKAMSSLEKGQGLVLVLVNLQ